jgi:hypothetical protein
MKEKPADRAEVLAIATIAAALIGDGSRTQEDIDYAISAALKLIATTERQLQTHQPPRTA